MARDNPDQGAEVGDSSSNQRKDFDGWLELLLVLLTYVVEHHDSPAVLMILVLVLVLRALASSVDRRG